MTEHKTPHQKSAPAGRAPLGARGRPTPRKGLARAADGGRDAAMRDGVALPPASLGFALDGAARVTAAVRAGVALPAALAAVTAPADALAARGAIQALSYRTMRTLGLADALVAALTRTAAPPHVANLLACALVLLAAPEAGTDYDAFTVVDQAVRAIGARRDLQHLKGLVNAVLRTFLREREALVEAARADPVACWNYPAWWIDAVRKAWPAQWQAILATGNTHAPLTLRVNARKGDVPAYLATLHAAGIDARASGAHGVLLARPLPVERLPGFAEGRVSVQDAGAQRAAPLLDARDGMRVLDACAAPGGKTGQLLELADLDLVALDSDAERARRIDDNLQRLGLHAQVRVGDARTPATWWDGQPFDRILADVPCSASGIVRRHPDIRWLRQPGDLETLPHEQRRIVDALWPLLKRGGELLYVTCSIFPAEGEAQAQWFEASRPDAVRLDAPGQLLPISAGQQDGPAPDQDGFFFARFRKR